MRRAFATFKVLNLLTDALRLAECFWKQCQIHIGLTKCQQNIGMPLAASIHLSHVGLVTCQHDTVQALLERFCVSFFFESSHAKEAVLHISACAARGD